LVLPSFGQSSVVALRCRRSPCRRFPAAFPVLRFGIHQYFLSLHPMALASGPRDGPHRCAPSPPPAQVWPGGCAPSWASLFGRFCSSPGFGLLLTPSQAPSFLHAPPFGSGHAADPRGSYLLPPCLIPWSAPAPPPRLPGLSCRQYFTPFPVLLAALPAPPPALATPSHLGSLFLLLPHPAAGIQGCSCSPLAVPTSLLPVPPPPGIFLSHCPHPRGPAFS